MHNENLKSSRYNEIFPAQSFLKLLTEVTHTQQNPRNTCTTQWVVTICPSNQHPNEQTSGAPLPPPLVTTLHPRDNHTATSLCTLSLWTLAGGDTEPRGSPHQSHQCWPAHYFLKGKRYLDLTGEETEAQSQVFDPAKGQIKCVNECVAMCM